MLPNLSMLPLDARGPSSSRGRREKILKRGTVRTPSTKLSDVESRWKVALKAHFGDDLLADGIGYRCWTDVRGLVVDENHFAWDEFMTEYGNVCMMVSTRALQDIGFYMGHGDRWEMATYGASVGDAPGPWCVRFTGSHLSFPPTPTPTHTHKMCTLLTATSIDSRGARFCVVFAWVLIPGIGT